ncbi:TPA: hypothetical protein IGZ65_005303 [Escherichia coli]|nr:hypothetical protein [Escherichia coli]
MHTITLTDEELCQLCWLWKISGNMQQTARKIYPILKAFESEHAPACHDAAFEYVHTIKTVHRALLRVTTHVEFTPGLSTNWRHILPQLRRI